MGRGPKRNREAAGDDNNGGGRFRTPAPVVRLPVERLAPCPLRMRAAANNVEAVA